MPINVGDFIFYHQGSEICVGKVLALYPESLRVVRGKIAWWEVRTDSDGNQIPIGVSTRHDWIWENGKYVLPKE